MFHPCLRRATAALRGRPFHLRLRRTASAFRGRLFHLRLRRTATAFRGRLFHLRLRRTASAFRGRWFHLRLRRTASAFGGGWFQLRLRRATAAFRGCFLDLGFRRSAATLWRGFGYRGLWWSSSTFFCGRIGSRSIAPCRSIHRSSPRPARRSRRIVFHQQRMSSIEINARYICGAKMSPDQRVGDCLFDIANAPGAVDPRITNTQRGCAVSIEARQWTGFSVVDTQSFANRVFPIVIPLG